MGVEGGHPPQVKNTDRGSLRVKCWGAGQNNYRLDRGSSKTEKIM